MYEKKYILYILQCADRSFYTGITTDLERRFQEHSQGKGAKYTRGRLPVKIVYSEIFENRSTASKAELAIKSLNKNQKEKLIQTFNK